MTQNLDARELDQLIRAITDEVLAYVGGGPVPGAPLVVSESARPEDSANHARKVSLVIDAGADRISATPSFAHLDTTIAALIDHTLLRPDASRSEIEMLCREAVQFGFASVCVNPWYVPLAARLTHGSKVKVCTVVGFPLGATLPQVKIYETLEALKLGAREIDVVQNIGALKSGNDDQVEAELRGVVQACHSGGAICKVILETALLTTGEKVCAAVIAKRAGADFVKTSTGFADSGATAADVALLRAAVGDRMGIKAAGGIRSLGDLEKMVSAGATRIGASASVRILVDAGKTAAAAPISPADYR